MSEFGGKAEDIYLTQLGHLSAPPLLSRLPAFLAVSGLSDFGFDLAEALACSPLKGALF
jgi:hypothetical protein